MKFIRIAVFAIATVFLVGGIGSADAFAGPKKVYLVNGLFSKVFGYGLTNLSRKIPYARHFKFAGGVPQSTINGIIADATRAYNADPTTEISLVGISQGAKAVASIAAALARQGVQVHYLAAIEGGDMVTVQDNVKKADSFVCDGADCARKPLYRAGGNSVTRMQTFTLHTGHIDSGNAPSMHSRVIAQINSN